MRSITEKDQDYIWHAYTQHKTSPLAIPIVKAKGAVLFAEDGRTYIDAIASWWVNPFGHSCKRLAKVGYHQLIHLEHILFGGFTHKPAVELAENLLKLLPNNQKKVFYSDNGSTAVEVAIKMSFQYHFNKNQKKTKLVAFEDAFHGDTFGAMAASGISLYTTAFKGQLIEVERIPYPKQGKEHISTEKLKEIIKKGNVSAFIFEPLVLGAAGMQMYSEKVLDEMIKICRENGVLTIADEVMTGFNKTGSLFACDFLSEKPDMICLSKALTGGTIPLAVTTTTQDVFDAFYSDEVSKALFHGHTFMANATACAIALESLKMHLEVQTQKNIKRIHKRHQIFAEKLKNHPKVSEIRLKGVIFALDIKVEQKTEYYGELRNQLYNFFIERGVILRPIYNTIYILPSFVMTNAELDCVYSVIEEALEKIVN